MGPDPVDHLPLEIAGRRFSLDADPLEEGEDLLAGFHAEFLGQITYANLVHPLPL
jgi:hypothetical protein